MFNGKINDKSLVLVICRFNFGNFFVVNYFERLNSKYFFEYIVDL